MSPESAASAGGVQWDCESSEGRGAQYRESETKPEGLRGGRAANKNLSADNWGMELMRCVNGISLNVLCRVVYLVSLLCKGLNGSFGNTNACLVEGVCVHVALEQSVEGL